MTAHDRTRLIGALGST